MFKYIKSAIVVSILAPLVSFAASPANLLKPGDNPGGLLPTSFRSQYTVTGIILAVLQLILGVVGLIAVAMIVWGGFRYVTSRGDAAVTKDAKSTILNALIGLIIVILSYVIVNVIVNAALGNIG